MLTPLNLDLIQDALGTRAGLLELASILGCFAIGWAVDRHVLISQQTRIPRCADRRGQCQPADLSADEPGFAAGGSRASFARWHLQTFFPIAIPLAIALALIRLCVYALRNLFGIRSPAATSELAVSLTIWGALLLYYLGVLQQVEAHAGRADAAHRQDRHQPAWISGATQLS